MIKRILLSCALLILLNQFAVAVDLGLTVESDKPDYILGDKAVFKGILKNLSQEYYIENGNVEYIFSVFQDGIEIWRWSELDCG
jgi:hypothetical protein